MGVKGMQQSTGHIVVERMQMLLNVKPILQTFYEYRRTAVHILKPVSFKF